MNDTNIVRLDDILELSGLSGTLLPFRYEYHPEYSKYAKVLTTNYRGLQLSITTLAYGELETLQSILPRLKPYGGVLWLLSSNTSGEYWKGGNPSGQHGQYIWAGVPRFKDKSLARVLADIKCDANITDNSNIEWVFADNAISGNHAAQECVSRIGTMLAIHHGKRLRSALFAPFQNPNKMK